MKISQLITDLSKVMQDYGDVEVLIDDGFVGLRRITEVDMGGDTEGCIIWIGEHVEVHDGD